MSLYRIFWIILVLFLLLPVALANKFYYRAEDITFNVKVSSNIHLISTSSNAEIDYIKANLSYFTKETDKQKIISRKNLPSAEITSDSILYQWNSPKKSPLEFSSEAKVKINNIPVKIKSKVDFPIKEEDIPEEVKVFVQPGIIIDSDNKAVIAKASELAEGDDDLFSVMHKLAAWTKSNIEYSLDTLTANASQKASWVLSNKEGVCDELTALFIAMARALGVPSKYVSGLAYTNYNNINDWGPHAWAEIYFPGYGWLPYDVTYGEFGFIDGSHITLKESLDASTSSSRYEWRSYNIDIQTEKLDFNVKAIDASADFAEEISLRVSALTNEINFGSYNLVQAEVQNLQDYYISTELYLARPGEVKIVGEERVQVMLKPKERKSVFWLVQVSDKLDNKYIYTFPLEVFGIKNESAKADFKASFNGQYNSREEMEAIIKANLQETKVYSKKIEIKCEPSKAEFYIYEKINVNCNVKNLGTLLLKDLRVCMLKDCKNIELGINQQMDVAFNVGFNSSGEKQVPVTVSGFEASKAAIIKVKVLDIPKFEINELNYPEKVKYGQEFEIMFKADNIAGFAKNVKIKVESGSLVKEFNIPSIEQSTVYKVKLRGKDLSEGENKFMVSIIYYDGNNREYGTSKEFVIELADVNILQKILLFINKILRGIDRAVG